MYTVKIRDHIMIAHSLPHKAFGPAQNMHGATYVVDAVFYSEELNDQNIVIDIGIAHKLLKEVLSELDYGNLDEMPQFDGVLTTTEFLARHIHDRLKKRSGDLYSGDLEIILGESHIAWASYRG